MSENFEHVPDDVPTELPEDAVQEYEEYDGDESRTSPETGTRYDDTGQPDSTPEDELPDEEI